MLNRCEFIGHMGRQAEVRVLDGGVKVASFSLAVTKRGYTLQNGTVVPDKTTWINVNAWRGLAELIEKWTDKGSHIYVAGELQIRTYEKDGIQKQITEIVAENIELLSRKQEAQQQTAAAPQQYKPDQSPASFGEPQRVPMQQPGNMFEPQGENGGFPF